MSVKETVIEGEIENNIFLYCFKVIYVCNVMCYMSNFCDSFTVRR